MTPASSERLRWSPHWRVELTSDGDLILTAGADRRYALRGIGAELGARAVSWSAGAPPTSPTPDEHRLIDRLVDAGALRPTGSAGRLHFTGDDPVVDELRAIPALRDIDLGGHGDLGLVVRTGDAWPAPPPILHLAVDCSLHHTIVIGPFVIPGHSACTSCLEARVARRWEPVAAAPRPAVQGHLPVIAHLLAVQIDLIARGASPLVNATIAWDLERASTDTQTLLKMPGCAACDPAGPSGRLARVGAALRPVAPV